MSFKEIKPEELQKNPFQMIGKEWLLVTAEKDGKANTMTASWGGVGVMWGRNVAFIVIRPQRYTKEFIDASDKLSLSVLDEEYRKTLSYLGSVSGRDEDCQKRSYRSSHGRCSVFCRSKYRDHRQKTLCTGIQTRMLYRFIS